MRVYCKINGNLACWSIQNEPEQGIVESIEVAINTVKEEPIKLDGAVLVLLQGGKK